MLYQCDVHVAGCLDVKAKYIQYFCSKLGKNILLSVLQLSSTAEEHKD